MPLLNATDLARPDPAGVAAAAATSRRLPARIWAQRRGRSGGGAWRRLLPGRAPHSPVPPLEPTPEEAADPPSPRLGFLSDRVSAGEDAALGAEDDAATDGGEEVAGGDVPPDYAYIFDNLTRSLIECYSEFVHAVAEDKDLYCDMNTSMDLAVPIVKHLDAVIGISDPSYPKVGGA